MGNFRRIPSIDRLLGRPALARAADERGRNVIVEAVRVATEEMRGQLAREAGSGDDESVAQWIESRAIAVAAGLTSPSLAPAINATGVILHTNLGRAPLAAAASASAAALAAGYSNLEYDVDTGERGQRHVHADRLLRELTGAESSLVVNNAAAAALLSMAALAAGREVVVSRGELVEIGGGFRVPDVLLQSGARLREVGTTNRTRVRDYTAAITTSTALILRVHPSNFRVEGFTERPALDELAAAAHACAVPLVEDLGSGWIGLAEAPPALADEPSIRGSLAAGADLVIFSGDKLLGGPQAGIVVGRTDLVDRLKRHPLMRALRVDKLTYGALEATLGLWLSERRRLELPVVRMLTDPATRIEARARRVASGLGDVAGMDLDVVLGHSAIGGGSAPETRLPTALLTVKVRDLTPDAVAARLRAHRPPVIARIHTDRVLLDLRTVRDDDDGVVAEALRSLAQKKEATDALATPSRPPGNTPR